MQNVLLAPGKLLTVTSPSTVSGSLTRLANVPGGSTGSAAAETVPAGVSVVKGPFATQTQWQFSDGFSYAVSDPTAVAAADGQVDLGSNFLDRTGVFEFFDDFVQAAINETDENWILNSGIDDLAADPAIVAAAGGTIFLDAGDGDGAIANDGSQMVFALPLTADLGGLFCEARVKIEDITGCSVNVGFTDVTTLEEPFSIATATITSVASDAVAFVFDDGATTKQWFKCGVAGDTDATGNGATGVAPVNDTYQVLRIEVDADGEGAEFFIDGVSVGRLTANVVTAATAIYFTAVVCGDGANGAAVGLTVDWVRIGHNR